MIDGSDTSDNVIVDWLLSCANRELERDIHPERRKVFSEVKAVIDFMRFCEEKKKISSPKGERPCTWCGGRGSIRNEVTEDRDQCGLCGGSGVMPEDDPCAHCSGYMCDEGDPCDEKRAWADAQGGERR